MLKMMRESRARTKDFSPQAMLAHLLLTLFCMAMALGILVAVMLWH